ncbi:MAG: hypothetical protein JXR07_04805 [Reichenbachiella sp.]
MNHFVEKPFAYLLLIIGSILLITVPSFSQKIHDFDSLYKQLPDYKSAIDKAYNSSDFFDDNLPTLNITLTSDFKKLTKTKDQSKYQKAQISLMLNDTVQLNQKLKIKTRGALRKEICYYPPIKLNFPKNDMVVESMREFDKMKMVSNCRPGNTYEQYIISEYLTYKIYNILTDYSLRVRLLNVKYVDTSGKYKPNTRHSFIIEPIEQLAARKSCIPVDLFKIHSKYMNAQEETTMAIFQYMIGNTDFSVPGAHNMKFIKSTDFSKPEPYAIPYDFDYIGMINAPYAIPSEALPIKKVTDRFFMGACRTKAEYKKTIEIFKSKKSEIYKLINTNQLLSKSNKKRHIRYLDQFYKAISTSYTINNDLKGNCLK